MLRPPMKLGHLVVVCGSLGVMFAACGRPELPVVVQKSRVGLRSDLQPGERVAFKRIASRDFAGAKPGFYALRSKYEFEVFRADLPRARALPPKDVAFGEEMLLAGYSPDPEMDKLGIDNIIDTGSGGLHVYATQYRSGEGCPAPQPGSAFDMVALPKSEKPITVHLDTDRAPACQASAPKAVAVCRIQNTATWHGTLSVPWQSTVECELQTEPAARPIVDRNWSIAEAAKGSTTRLSLSRGGSKVTFPVDALGRYAIRLDTFDDEGTKGASTATIDSVPANDDTYLQFGWSNFTSTDDLETFPRLDFRVADVGSKGMAVSSSCTAQGQRPAWCEVTTSSSVTVIRVGEAPGRYALTVRYLDDRYKGMPIACVRVFKKRALVTEVCDDVPRRAGEAWEPGVVLAANGYFAGMVMPNGEVAGAPPPDAGAPSGDASVDAGATAASDAGADAAAKKPAAPKKK